MAADATLSLPAPDPEPEPPKATDFQRDPPEGWTDLRTIDGMKFHIGYHTPVNFTDAPLPGYGAPGAWMLDEPAAALAKVHADLQDKGMGLLVYDAYRPLRGTLGMVAWAHRTNQVHLLDNGYIARRSGHNKGHTIDLTIFDAETGEPLDMGTPWDTLSEASHTKNATGQAQKNRWMFVEAMRKHNFQNYWKEWWHFSFKMPKEESRKLKHRDVPYSCFEPDEGQWTPPKGWKDPSHQMPMKWDPKPCEASD